MARLFHENTKTDVIRYETHAQKTDAVDATVEHVDPDYPAAETVSLPDGVELDADLTTALGRRRSVREFTDESLTLREFAGLLEHGAGVTGAGDRRSYPSPGALYPSELYLFVRSVEEVPQGLYYYNARRHVLRRLSEGGPGFDDRLRDAVIEGSYADVRSAAVVFAVTGTLPRVTFKYGPRGYRYVLQESGHLVQNLLLVAAGLELAGIPQAAFRDGRMNEALGVDGVDEFVTYTAVVGRPPEGSR